MKRIAATLLLLALYVGHDPTNQDPNTTRTAPTSDVPPNIARVCTPNGGIAAVTEQVTDPYVLHVRCANGVVLVSPAVP